MWLQATSLLEFNLPVDTPFLFMLRPRSSERQWVAREEFLLSSGAAAEEFTDLFGNLCQRMNAPAGAFSIRTLVQVETADRADVAPGAPFVEVAQLPTEVLPFVLPSRYCEADRFSTLASQIVGSLTPGYDQCAAIVDYVRQTTRYAPGEPGSIVSACEVNESPSGVCRDLAHLGIALCRALSIPSRMVVGYLQGLDPMDQHAWFECYVGDRWYTFDPTQPHLNGGRIAIACGRDAADVALYTQFGSFVDLLTLDVTVSAISRPG